MPDKFPFVPSLVYASLVPSLTSPRDTKFFFFFLQSNGTSKMPGYAVEIVPAEGPFGEFEVDVSKLLLGFWFLVF